MNIITASKFYYPRAGLETYLLNITEVLRENGHKIIPFSTNYPENLKTKYDDFFTEYIELGGKSKTNLYDKLGALIKLLYNFDAQNKLSQLIDYTQPDLIWAFGVHQHLSPSVFVTAKRKNIPIIHLLSDYSIICPDFNLTKNGASHSRLLSPTKGCFSAIANRYAKLSSLSYPNKQPSLSSSIIGAVELYFYDKFKLYINNVDKFIVPSRFLKQVMINNGMPVTKIDHLPIFIEPDNYMPEYSSQAYFVYFGSLSHEKGLITLFDVMFRLKHHKLMLIGDGPQRHLLEKIKVEKNLDNIKFFGKLHGEQLKRIIRNSRFVIVPSTWYDNSPNVILESFALGKPVLGASIGDIPEYIEESNTGLLYTHNNSEELESKIDFLMNQSALCKEMGTYARKLIEAEYNPKVHYKELMKIVKTVVNH